MTFACRRSSEGDRWASESTTHSMVDKSIAPSHLTSGTDEIDLFRFFDPETWETGFWGQRFDVRAVVEEAARLMPPIDPDDYYGPTPSEDWDDIVAAWGPRASRQ
jgi:hypothetical protein